MWLQKNLSLDSPQPAKVKKYLLCSSFVAVDPKGKREQNIRKDESPDEGVGSRKPDHMSYSSHKLMRA